VSLAPQHRTINMSGWARHNLWPLPSGEVAVRPGLRRTHAADLTGTSVPGGCFSVRTDTDDEVYHYRVYESSGAVYVDRIDEAYATQTLIAWSTVTPEIVTHAVVGDQIMIAAPGLPTLWGYVGGDLYEAAKKEGVNPDLTALEIPSGVCVGWAGRVVISTGLGLYFSDAIGPTAPNAIRTFVSPNVLDPPGGSVMDLRVTSSGDLYAITTTGVYALSREASTAGQIVLGVWRKVSDYLAPKRGCTTTSRGRVWGLTRAGVRLVDTADPYEIQLAEPRVSKTTSDPISTHDFRLQGYLCAGEDGVIVSMPQQKVLCAFDEASQTFSWWSSTGSGSEVSLDVVGTGFDELGRMLLFTSNQILRPVGNQDQGNPTVYGTFLGRVPTSPGQSLIVREIQPASDTSGSIVASVGGTQKTATPPQVGILLGAGDNGDSWVTAPLRSRQLLFASRSDDHGMEVGASGCLSRVSEAVDVALTGIGKKRGSN
jgi:hypothetical protein